MQTQVFFVVVFCVWFLWQHVAGRVHSPPSSNVPLTTAPGEAVTTAAAARALLFHFLRMRQRQAIGLAGEASLIYGSGVTSGAVTQ